MPRRSDILERLDVWRMEKLKRLTERARGTDYLVLKLYVDGRGNFFTPKVLACADCDPFPDGNPQHRRTWHDAS